MSFLQQPTIISVLNQHVEVFHNILIHLLQGHDYRREFQVEEFCKFWENNVHKQMYVLS